jgi:hypothetical protein
MARPHRPPAIWLAVIIASAVVVIGGAVAVVAGTTGNTGTSSSDTHNATHGGATPAALRPDPPPVRLGPQGAHPQFVVECDWSHSAPDDPIVLAGQPGNSHLHEFFGATGTDAFSTGESLLNGDTTCQNRADTAAYWVPALYDGTTRVQPNELVAYYRTGDGIDPATVEPWPVGLVMLAGDPGAEQAQSLGVVGWTCGASDHLTVLPRQCSPRAPLVLRLTFPDCWDGTSLDSGDHRAHTTYSSDGSCPATHATPIVQLVLAVRYDFAGDPVGLRLASGSMITGHGDVMNGWSHDELAKLTNVCLRRSQVCGISSNRTDV